MGKYGHHCIHSYAFDVVFVLFQQENSFEENMEKNYPLGVYKDKYKEEK